MTDDEDTIPVAVDDLAESEYILRTLADVAQALDDDQLATRAATLADRFQMSRLEAVPREEVQEA